MSTIVFQLLAAVMIVIIAFALPQLGLVDLRPLRKGFDFVARRKWLAVGLVASFAFAECAALGHFVHLPQPAIHDEFCYLLGADTFAHGRLTNPTHPHWQHFESFHIIHEPTYQMKYPPAQSMVLALGQVMWHPILGVWLSVAAACGGICWMLQGWVPPRWALLGGLLSAVSSNIVLLWGETYWGGAVAMLGGCLLFGGLRRMIREPNGWHAIPFALGLVILANSRPYEGLVAALCTLVVFVPWLLSRRRPTWQTLATQIVAPSLVILLPAGAWMAYFNQQVTNDPLRLPYQEWARTYGGGSEITKHMFSFAGTKNGSKRLRSIPFPNRASVEKRAAKGQPPPTQWEVYKRRLNTQWSFYLGPLLTLPMVTMPWVLRNRWMWFAAFASCLVILSVALQSTWGHAHYAAPCACLLMLLVVQSMRHMVFCRAGVGRAIVRAIPVALAASLVISLIGWARQPIVPFHHWSLHRSSLAQQLEADGKKHLVVVRYAPEHHHYQEWVYNGADIDSQKVVWARELTPQQNTRLLDDFAEREIWLLEADELEPKLVRHRAGSTDSIVLNPTTNDGTAQSPDTETDSRHTRKASG